MRFPQRMMQFFPEVEGDGAGTVAVRRARVVSEPLRDYLLYSRSYAFTKRRSG